VTSSTPPPPSPDPVFDPFDPEWATNPFPLYADLRQRAPVHRNALGFWVFARHADCLALLRDRRTSADDAYIDPERLSAEFRFGSGADDPEVTAMRDMRPFLFRDPPDHTRLRGLVSKAFTPKVVESLRARTQQIVDELLDTAFEADRVDLLESFAYPLPVRIICDMLGVPVADQDRFKSWSTSLARGLDPDFLLTGEAIKDRDDAVMQFAQYFFELLAERRRSPGDDLLAGWSRWRTMAAYSVRLSCCRPASCCWWPATKPPSISYPAGLSPCSATPISSSGSVPIRR
jgi:cytochrome P450